jgi:DnaJ like chaperone protein
MLIGRTMSFWYILKRYSGWGKFLGILLGFLAAGPLGSLFGLFIGNLFDRGLNEHFSKPHWAYHAEKKANVKKAFQHATFSIMGHLCKTDGRISEEDIQFAKKTMQALHLNRSERNAAREAFTEGKSNGFKLDLPLQNLRNLALHNPKLLRAFMQIQYQAAQINGLTQNKTKLLNHLLHQLNFAPLHEQAAAREAFYAQFNQHTRQHHHYQQHHTHQQKSYERPQQYAPNIDSLYTLLGVSPTANKQEVKRAYRKKVSLYHPDKYIAKGHSEAQIKQANEKTQAIRKAYDAICTYKGW